MSASKLRAALEREAVATGPEVGARTDLDGVRGEREVAAES